MSNNQLGNRLRFFRKRIGLSQFSVELELNMSQGSLSRIESGAINPTKETIEKIAELLKLDKHELSYIYGIFDNPPTIVQINAVKADLQKYLENPNSFGYILDERWNIIDFTKGFENLFPLKNKTALLKIIRGSSIFKIVFDPNYQVNQFIDFSNETLLNVLLARFKHESYYLQNEDWFADLLNSLLTFSDFKKVWDNLVDTNIDYYLKKPKTIKYILPNSKYGLIYSIDFIKKQPMFSVVNYILDKILIII